MTLRIAGRRDASERTDEPCAHPSRSLVTIIQARTLSLLCMDDADTITGAMIAIDGGVSPGLLGSQMNYLTCAQLLPES